MTFIIGIKPIKQPNPQVTTPVKNAVPPHPRKIKIFTIAEIRKKVLDDCISDGMFMLQFLILSLLR